MSLSSIHFKQSTVSYCITGNKDRQCASSLVPSLSDYHPAYRSYNTSHMKSGETHSKSDAGYEFIIKLY